MFVKQVKGVAVAKIISRCLDVFKLTVILVKEVVSQLRYGDQTLETSVEVAIYAGVFYANHSN